jgi:8-oxo-dGTP pyrophosphatase MutT (NUDIX family)
MTSNIIRSRNHPKQFNLKQKHTYSNNVYNNRQRTARPSWGIFCYKLMENIEDTKYLMVRRRNSYAYEEFLRGSYHIDDLNYIRELMSRLTKNEADRILSSEFDDLWRDLNKAYPITTTHPQKLKFARENFNIIKDNPHLYNLDKDYIIWEEPEWCFPKGKKNHHQERDDVCAKRELDEETKLKPNDYEFHPNDPMKIKYTADNGVEYENTYYFAEIKDLHDIFIDESDERQKAEVGAIEWFTKGECDLKIRYYHEYFKEVLSKGVEICNKLYLNDKKNVELVNESSN